MTHTNSFIYRLLPYGDNRSDDSVRFEGIYHQLGVKNRTLMGEILSDYVCLILEDLVDTCRYHGPLQQFTDRHCASPGRYMGTHTEGEGFTQATQARLQRNDCTRSLV